MGTTGRFISESTPPIGERARPNTLNLRGMALEAMLDVLDAQEPPSPRRKYARWVFRRESVAVRLVHTGGSTHIKVATRNLSRGGMSLLHSNFMHPHTKCEISLPHPSRGMMPVHGRVIRCLHHAGMVHEVGVKFDAPIDARNIADIDPMDNLFSYADVPADLLGGGCALIGGRPDDAALIRHILGETPMTFAAIPALPANPSVLAGVDVVILPTDLPDGTPKMNVGALRDTGYAGAIVLLAPDREPRTRLASLAAPADVIVVRPLERRELLLAIAECELIIRPGRVA